MFSSALEVIVDLMLKIFRFIEGGDKNEISEAERIKLAQETIARLDNFNKVA